MLLEREWQLFRAHRHSVLGPLIVRDCAVSTCAFKVARALSKLGAMTASAGVLVAVETHMGRFTTPLHDTHGSRQGGVTSSRRVAESRRHAGRDAGGRSAGRDPAIRGGTFYVCLKNTLLSPAEFDWGTPIERGVVDDAACHKHYTPTMRVLSK